MLRNRACRVSRSGHFLIQFQAGKTMHKLVPIYGLLTTLALAGCGSLPCGNPHAYAGSIAEAPLKAPEGLKAPSPDPGYQIPGGAPASAQSAQNTPVDGSGGCLVRPPEIVTPESMVGPKNPASSPGSTISPAPKGKPAASPAPEAGTKGQPAVASGGPIG